MPRPDASLERDACGIGFVAEGHGRASRALVDDVLEALCRVRHRGAVAADALTGDGAGLLLPLPRRILTESLEGDVPRGRALGVAMAFLDPGDPGPGRVAIETACAAEDVKILDWRTVPVDERALGERARREAPLIEQAILARPDDDDKANERAAYRTRRRIERMAREENLVLYIPSLSFKTVTYKALCAADQLGSFYPDLVDSRFEGWFGIFHQRYSTNTTPTWERAQPFRFLGHNGEINTIRGNTALLRGREGHFGAPDLIPEDLLRPVIEPGSSDSGVLDQALELLVRGGRSVEHALSMLIPPAWEGIKNIEDNVRAFLAYHSCLLEPWDGPAALVYSDGDVVGSALDRNGLRPLRISVCEDGFVACASEAGAVDTSGHGSVKRLRLGPGESFIVDPARGGAVQDVELKQTLAGHAPYARWIEHNARRSSTGTPVDTAGTNATQRQVAAGYTKEEFTVVIRPMATEAAEPTSSMGDDTAQPPLSRFARPIFNFLKQRFAQVTNPPIDHLRERHVMSITTRLGARSHLLQERPEAAALRHFDSFVLFPSAVAELEGEGGLRLDATFPVSEGPAGLESACRRLADEAVQHVASGGDLLVVSDRAAGTERAAVPIALAAGAVHHRLLKEGLRSQTGMVVDADEPRETHHVACLLTNGADAICPRLAFDSIAELAAKGRLGGGVESKDAQRNFVSALEDGLLKVMSKMGIATLDSYRSAQIIEAIGLAPEVVDLCFTGLGSPLGGLTFTDIAEDALGRHRAAYSAKPVLPSTGFVKHKAGGEYHALNPEVIDRLHEVVGIKEVDPDMAAAHELRRAVRGSDEAYERFAALVDGRPPVEPRDLLDLVRAPSPIPLDEVEPASAIARRFSTGAMSHGALSAEAHETLALAMNLIGGQANTGEGGEDPERYLDARNSGIKQIASGRFGVTPAYVAFADELQIKMAQGSKPGEGGQLPGKKVSVEIARLRHTVPGVALISPPPHHDIYSIEDLAQLIYDLKQANPTAAVSVKLVSSDGVGTIAAGVVKGLADVVHIAGGDGGTGASPLSSIKNAGMPWEIGLVETQAALAANGLRGRARVRIDGGIKTGRDIVVAALLGADEYSFGTAALVAEGCILVRTCHRNTCPVGIATQDPKLRAKFEGTPEMVARYMMLVAEDVRTHLASLGLRTVAEAVGRTELLRRRAEVNETNARTLDVARLITGVDGEAERRFTGSVALQLPRSELGDRLFEDAAPAIESGRDVQLAYDITTADRTVGARLGCALGRRSQGDPRPGNIAAHFRGQAGQSFGAFLHDGIELTLTGEANDYVCKSMGGGRVVVRPPKDDAGDPYLVGNTVLYGATGGSLYVAGRAGERFGVRNSGAVAVVEGTGDHACEYMTAGAVVILGPTGINLGAGMSGGEAYVFDPEQTIGDRINEQLVAAYEPTSGQLESLRRVLGRHVDLTGSPKASAILTEWARSSKSFSRIAPKAEVARLEALFEGTAAAAA